MLMRHDQKKHERYYYNMSQQLQYDLARKQGKALGLDDKGADVYAGLTPWSSKSLNLKTEGSHTNYYSDEPKGFFHKLLIFLLIIFGCIIAYVALDLAISMIPLFFR